VLFSLLLGWPVATINGVASAAYAHAANKSLTYYVARWGSDLNPGTDPGHPWRSIARVNRAQLRRGDQVLFRGGETFTDDTLMPGHGAMVSGTAAAPITFSSYGGGLARLTSGIWLGANWLFPAGPSHLTFKNLALGPLQGFQGTANYVMLTGLRISNVVSPNSEVGIETEGSHWRIVGNTINATGDSGMLLGFDVTRPGEVEGGDDYLVSNNVITRTGLDSRLTIGTHGIYAKVADATISHNRITQFRNDGVSVRYRNAQVVNNYIGTGNIGIGWFQYDTLPGSSRFVGNTIEHTRAAAIFVCGLLEGCRQPIESFLIAGNTLLDTQGDILNLQPTFGIYRVFRNFQ
jgi:Right handed beta helix region